VSRLLIDEVLINIVLAHMLTAVRMRDLLVNSKTIMQLNNDIKKRYRSIGHNLKPIVTVAGKGLTENVLAELERALEDHELIKIKIVADDRDARRALIAEICQSTKATNVQEIGKIALLYRSAKKPNPKLSNLQKL